MANNYLDDLNDSQKEAVINTEGPTLVIAGAGAGKTRVLDERVLTKGCSACGGRGRIKLDMGFLPAEFVECETCRATGYCPEAWDVSYNFV